MRFGLNDEVIAKISAVLSRFPQVEWAILYGSRAKGNYKPGSDFSKKQPGSHNRTCLFVFTVFQFCD
jgi:uncharacterized protein